jgi:hypothetical protein
MEVLRHLRRVNHQLLDIVALPSSCPHISTGDINTNTNTKGGL